jgi:hypothetical protein
MWHKARAQPSQCGAGQPGVGTISISGLLTCQGGSMHGVSDAQSRWRPSWVGGRPCVHRPARVWLVTTTNQW